MILSFMNKYSDSLSGVFQALADPTRRAVIVRLGRGPARVTELAQPFGMALPSFMKHIRVLEQVGLITTHKSGRVRTCEIDRKQFRTAETWLAEQRALWEGRANRLEEFVSRIQKSEKPE